MAQATWQRHLCNACPGQKWPNCKKARSQQAHQIIGSFSLRNRAGINLERIAIKVKPHAQSSQNLAHAANIGQRWNIA